MKKYYTLLSLLIAAFYFFTPLASQAQTRLADSTALVALYNNNGGTGWINSTNWLTTQPINTWYGVHVSPTGRVDSVSLPGNNLINAFPNTVNSSTVLAKFDVSHNSLTGNMPYFFGDSLVILNVAFNQLTGGINFYDLPNLVVFRINNNNFSGGAGAVGGYPKIKEVNESHNNFTGPLPYYGNYLFDSIDVSYNQLTGSVDFFIYPNANYYNISHNQLSGSWGFFNGTTATAVLDVSHNKFTFNELEPVFSSLAPKCTYAPQDTLLPLHSSAGKLSVTAGGTLSNDSYTWYKANTLQTTTTGDSTYKPAAAGNYSVSVTNSIVTGLTLHSDTVAVSLLNITVVVTPASSCANGNNAGINVFLTGGTAPFTYVLTKPGGGTVTQTKDVFSNLAPGAYSLTVTDKNNNTATDTGIVISQAAAITPKATVSPTSSCTAANVGSILAGANGGIAPFHYVLTGPGNTTTAQKGGLFGNLAAGTYSITAIDTAGCTGQLTGLAVQATPITVTPAITLVSNCGNGKDGSIKAANTGGVAPFEYLLTKPNNSTETQASPIFSGLSTGAYSLTITDAAGCTGTLTGIALAQAAPITVLPGVTQTSSCGSGNDGSISVGLTGGVSPFHYLLTKPDNSTIAQTSLVFSNLSAGIYSVKVTDNAGCTGSSAGITITQAPAITAKATLTPASSCGNGSDGSILAGAQGGVAPYHYVLALPNNSAVAQAPALFSSLSPGTYSVTAFDAAGCTGSITALTVTKAAPITQTDVISPLKACNYGNNEQLTIKAQGGITPYAYSLQASYSSTPFVTQSSPVFNNINAGLINVIVTDHSGCADTAINYNVPYGPHPMLTDTSETAPSCITATNGTITAGVTGGTAPYVIYLENSGYGIVAYSLISNQTFTGLADGTYILLAQDAESCSTGYSSITLNTSVPCTTPAGAEPPTTSGDEAIAGRTAENFAVQVLPNPTRTVFTLALTSQKNDPVEITVTDMYGKTVHHATAPANSQYSFGSTLAAGMYIARVMQGNEVKVVKMIKQ